MKWNRDAVSNKDECRRGSRKSIKSAGCDKVIREILSGHNVKEKGGGSSYALRLNLV